MGRVYLLSPANCGGKRAGYLLRPGASFALARRLRGERVDGRGSATLGEVFAFMSGLYFRGKLAYAQHFARPRDRPDGALVITPGRGLVPAGRVVSRDELEAIAAVPVDVTDPAYLDPLRAAADRLAGTLGGREQAVLLGSIATDKYVGVLRAALGDRLRFPRQFVGRGDMSRGGLMLRCVDADQPLDYVRIDEAPRRGKRPPRLAPR